MIKKIKKILFVIGTRPEAIKLAPIILDLRKRVRNFKVIVCVTAQHREMLDQILKLFKIKPDYDLNIMRKDQSLFQITVKAMKKLEKVLKTEKPDLVVVQGDTTTTFIASLAAYYLKIKVAHVEAGLRTEDKFSPFPEEINRRLTDCIADLYFVPTIKAKENLLKEGVKEDRIFVTGNTVVDALFMIMNMQAEDSPERLDRIFLERYGISFDRKTILVTAHRRESFGKDFEEICYGLKMIAENSDVQIVYPVHLNPNVQKPVKKILYGLKNIYLIEPLDYYHFVWLMRKSYLILTDSGGIQEEAPTLMKPVLVMRKKTERPEGIEEGVAKVVGTDRFRIYTETMRLLEEEGLHERMLKIHNPYGDGLAHYRIAAVIEEEL